MAKNKAKWAEEITYDVSSGTGNFIAFSSALSVEPAILIFDNQSDSTVEISDDGEDTAFTFVAGEALVLDLRTNRLPKAENLTFRIGTQFFASSAAGIGIFRIGVIYAE